MNGLARSRMTFSQCELRWDRVKNERTFGPIILAVIPTTGTMCRLAHLTNQDFRPRGLAAPIGNPRWPVLARVWLEPALKRSEGAGVLGIEALGRRMAERVQQSGILAGDITIEHNDNPEYGGLELRLEDIVKSEQAQSATALSR
jgi:hypothetical protein